MRYLYHLTDKESAKTILRDGLLPKIGPRSQIMEEANSFIYLSDKKSVPYWSTLLSQAELLRIDMYGLDKEKLREYPYAEYTEWTYAEKINPEWICRSNVSVQPTNEQKQLLCLSYIDSISNLCVSFAKYVTYHDNEDPELKRYAQDHYETCHSACNALKYVFRALDFACLEHDILRKHLKDMGENGVYTLCDRYEANWIPSSTRLWQLLGTHELADDDTKWVYRWLRKTFPRKLYVETGGWTG